MVILVFGLAAAICAVFALALSRSHASNIFRATGSLKAQLSFTPSQLSRTDITVLVLLVIFKHINKLIGRLPPFRAANNGMDFALPSLTLSAPLLVDSSDLQRFAIAVGRQETNANGVDASPLLLPAVTTPLLLVLLSNRGCPVLPFGAVNTKNRFEFLDPVACRSVASLKDLTVTSRLGGDDLLGRRVKRGMEFDIVIEVEGKPDWAPERKLIFRQIIGILTFLPKSTKPLWNSMRDTVNKEDPIGAPTSLPQQLTLSLNAPTAWAAVCKDVNPIHMSSLAAKIFGFPGKIAHGNHVIAHVLEKQRNVNVAQDHSRSLLWQTENPWFLSVDFRRPMVLPSVLDIIFTTEGEKGNQSMYGFEVLRGEKVHVTGIYGKL